MSNCAKEGVTAAAAGNVVANDAGLVVMLSVGSGSKDVCFALYKTCVMGRKTAALVNAE